MPKTRTIWRKVTPNGDPRGIVDAMRDMTAKPIALLNEVSAEKLDRIKSGLPGLIKSTRAKDNPLRKCLDRLFQSPRECPEDFDFRRESWPTSNQTSPASLSLSGLMAEPFSISGDAGNRIQAFFATAKENAAIERPLILLLSGNPPGTKESLAGTAAFFAGLGYHAIAVDRRPSSRLWDNKDKFPSDLTDPVFDVLRLLDFLKNQTVYKISKIGIYGFSAGASEGKFIAALEDRIEAAVLACGLTSHDWLFRDEAWLPTYSGMMIFPELGLGRPEIGKLTSSQWEEYLMKLKPEHNARARKVFQSVFPFFEDLDPVKVVPLIAPVPLLIVTGAQDDQYKVPGVVEVDRAAQEAYAALGLGDCSELFIGPRIGHGVDPRGMPVIAAFFDRWLKQ